MLICLYGEAPPRDPTLYTLMNHFLCKRYPFRLPSFDKWYHFHRPYLELCIPFNYRYCTVLIRINHRKRTFFRLFKGIKFICQPFQLFLCTSCSQIPTLCQKKIPLLLGASLCRPSQGVPPPSPGIKAYKRLWLDFHTKPYIYYACSNILKLFHTHI